MPTPDSPLTVDKPRSNRTFWIILLSLFVLGTASVTGMFIIGNDLISVTAQATRSRMDSALLIPKLTDADRAMIREELEALVIRFEARRLSYPPIGDYMETFGTGPVLRIGMVRAWAQLLQEAGSLDEATRVAVDRYCHAIALGIADEQPGMILARQWAGEGGGDAQATDPRFVQQWGVATTNTPLPPVQPGDEPFDFRAYVREQVAAVQ